jgi:chemotaxis protein methyltransferase CheR
MPGDVSQRELSLVPGSEFAFTWSDFRKIAALVHSEAGIVVGENKVNFVYSRLAKRLRAVGLNSFRDYCALVSSAAGVDERQSMIAAMTTNVTRFFREQHHFDYLARVILPGFVTSLRTGGRLRIWSAGCSSGEEPYSIALTLLSVMPDAPGHDVLILASDIDRNMLDRGETAMYSRELAESIPVELRHKWLDPAARGETDGYRMADAVCSLVRFRELNLLGHWPITRKFDVIFCRNVMIYFDEPTQDKIWSRFAAVMQPGGILCIGHSERIALDKHPFDLIAQTTYRRKPGTR